MSTERTARSWIEVDGAALRRNLRRVRARVGPEVRLLPMVKADAYGLGVGPAVRALEAEAPWGYGVATVEEGLELRDLGVSKPVVVFSPLPPGQATPAVQAGLALAVSGIPALEEVVATARSLNRSAAVHIEIDSGMGRAGFHWTEAEEWGPAVERLVGGPVKWEGCFTHFHSADESGGADTVAEQARRFFGAVERIPTPESGDFIVHLCNSAAAVRFPEFARGMVRPGIFLYGGGVGGGEDDTSGTEPEPVAALRSRIALIREVPEGTTLGYGATYRAERAERWATVGLGYGDGLRRVLGNRGSALVSGRRVPIIGRISMDMTVVDITELPATRSGDVVTFLGRDGDEVIGLDTMAGEVGTISYEILTGLSGRLPRVWSGVGDG